MLSVDDSEECGVGVGVKKTVVYYEATNRNTIQKSKRHTNLHSTVLTTVLYSNQPSRYTCLTGIHSRCLAVQRQEVFQIQTSTRNRRG
jgi:hypothetical protein